MKTLARSHSFWALSSCSLKISQENTERHCELFTLALGNAFYCALLKNIGKAIYSMAFLLGIMATFAST